MPAKPCHAYAHEAMHIFYKALLFSCIDSEFNEENRVILNHTDENTDVPNWLLNYERAKFSLNRQEWKI